MTATHTMRDALDEAKQTRFDVLISDLGLPDGDGCHLMSELRREDGALPGNAISGYGMESDVSRTNGLPVSRRIKGGRWPCWMPCWPGASSGNRKPSACVAIAGI